MRLILLLGQVMHHTPFPLDLAATRPLYVVGDSHCLSSAWQTVRSPRQLPLRYMQRWRRTGGNPLQVSVEGERYLLHPKLVRRRRRWVAVEDPNVGVRGVGSIWPTFSPHTQ